MKGKAIEPIERLEDKESAALGSGASTRTWRHKFADAWRGVKLGVRGQSSFFVHFFVAAAALTAAWVMSLDWVSWCLVILCIGTVLAAEMFNSALEALCRGLDERSRSRCAPALDIAAGAVLITAGTAAIVGAIIFINRLAQMLHWW
ncbi:MAG: diacylglycerol kinase [Gemmatales bacterium]|nr:diacylglycerol kinase [Gemmatales bacterium]MCS7160814.1 diacylglycerol kinase [Gemmatales bacterium]MDW8176015.1 diacylglycerol kinase [Gemmatales bacterium]MDW8223696.1 diacylglycerol kinase [Gemmatales bacterium]